MQIRREALFALLMLILGSVPLFSQSGGELNLYGGWSLFTTESFEIGEPQSPTPIPLTFSMEDGLRSGLRINFLTKGKWGSEAYYGYQSTTATFTRADNATRPLELPTQVHQFGANVLYYPLGTEDTDERFIVPFASAGLGAAIYRPTSEAKRIASDPLQGNISELIESGRFSLNYGFGVRRRLNGMFGVRFDVRGFLSRSPTFGLPDSSEDPTVTVLPLNNLLHSAEVSVGITIKLWN